LLLFFCCTIVDTKLLEVHLDDDGTTTLGITAATNDGRLEIWALIFEVHRECFGYCAFCAAAAAVMVEAEVVRPPPSDVAAAKEVMRGGTAGTRGLFGSAMAGIACAAAATAGPAAAVTAAVALGCRFR